MFLLKGLDLIYSCIMTEMQMFWLPSLFILDTPRHWEVIKRRSAISICFAKLRFRSTGISPLRGSLRAAPIAWSEINRAVAGREYHCPHCLSSPYRGQPDIFSRRFLAHRAGKRNNKHKKLTLFSFVPRGIMAQPLTWLPLFTQRQWECAWWMGIQFSRCAHSPHKRRTGEGQ